MPDALANSGPAGVDLQRIRDAAWTLIAFCLAAVLAGWSRKWPPTFLLEPCGDVMRWREALSMMFFGPLLVLLLWRLYLVAADREVGLWGTLFLAGVYFLGLGMGMHDTCDLLPKAYRNAPADIVGSLRYFDDELGHWIYFIGFVAVTVTTGVQQLRHALRERMSWGWTALFLALSTPMMFTMLSNLMFEKTGVDLCVIAAAVLGIAVFHCRYRVGLRRLPILCVLYPAYTVAIVGSLAYWAVHGR